MIAYGIGVLPLIRELQGDYPFVTQPWYADDAGAVRKFGHILAHLWDLQTRGLQVVTGHRYLGVFIEDREAKEMWLEDKIMG